MAIFCKDSLPRRRIGVQTVREALCPQSLETTHPRFLSGPWRAVGLSGLSSLSQRRREQLVEGDKGGSRKGGAPKQPVRPPDAQGGGRPRGLPPTRLLCPWDSPGKNTGAGCHSLLHGIFLTRGLNLGLLHCRQILYH